MFNSDEGFTHMFNLGILSGENINITKDNIIEYRKRMSKLFSKSRKDAKSEECFYCGKKCSSFCNSHSIPAFLLRNIAVEGEVYNNNKLVQILLLDDEDGVNQSGTFQLICRECDSKIFSDYENPDNYGDVPTSRMIAQIAMKNYLKGISKRKFEIALFDNMKSDLGLPSELHKQKQLVNNLDLQEYYEGFKRAKRVDNKGWEKEYYLFYHQKLDYVVPIAFQSNITLLVDFEGNIINDLYNMSSQYKTRDIHICVFPLEKSSVIMMFVDSKHKRYRRFYRQFRKLSHEDKLAAVNYIIFNFSEELYINKEVNKQVLDDKKLIEAGRKTVDIISSEPIDNPKLIARKNFDFSLMHEVPNLLLEKYKIR
ncbi:hypothetical protein [Selenihalanaerobacter shriftii]|uniref:Uncharacterized protein n=1 Tax=Selenihalanaerobacter shriftii TaxID=142842 RepID=A0A1T4NT08_9FIRM|nr:hypothetical protein [Selenihalanaerobacter shriftii]SJZ82343.1 hypothetical protein SAMN02745118_01908 [Selenihalanaerobacter shriftii]